MFKNYTAKDYEDFNIDVNYVHFSFLKICPKNYRYETEKREYYGLVLFAKGECEFHFRDGGAFTAKRGDLVYLKKGDSYYFFSKGRENPEYYVTSFDMADDKSISLLPLERINKLSKFTRFEELFNYLSDIWYVKNIGYKLHIKAIIELTIYELIHDCFSKQFREKSLPVLQATVDYIERNYDKPISIATLSKISSYSPTHYRRRFKSIYGITPVEYINSVRIEKAKDLIKSGLYSTEEIAEKCGFNSAYYFSRVFKKITGFPPGKY